MNNGILTQSAQPVAMPYGLLGRPTPVPMPAVDYAFDVDAADYIRRVEAADGRALELPIRLALDAFVRGCKADGTWNAIKAACILAGANSLSAALVPLVGTAPTNFNFVNGDYNRKTGLVGDGSTKYLASNRSNASDPRDSNHNAAFISLRPTVDGALFSATGDSGGNAGTNILAYRASSAAGSPGLQSRNRSSTFTVVSGLGEGFKAMSRSNSSQYITRNNGLSTTVLTASDGDGVGSVELYRRNINNTALDLYFNGRLSFYSIGEALDLALLDARVTTLMNTLAAVL